MIFVNCYCNWFNFILGLNIMISFRWTDEKSFFLNEIVEENFSLKK